MIDKQNEVHPHDRILRSLKKTETQMPATIQKNLEDITLSEIRQTPSDKFCMIHFHGDSVSLWEDERVLERDGGNVAPQ